MKSASPAVRTVVLLVLGVALLELCWVAVLPPFRGSDEVDHAYRAAAVAEGQWLTRAVPEDARGLLVRVPADVVVAARPECRSHGSSTTETCTGSRVTGRDDLLEVASGAGAYQPLYYWVVGTAARPLAGSAALYAMRLASVVLCLGLLALAAAFSVRLGRWSVVALLSACLPSMTYSMAVAAPNGPEMAAAAAWWCGLLAWSPSSGRSATRGGLALGVAGAVLCVLRLLGPLFLLLSLALVLLARSVGLRDVRARWRSWRLPAGLVLAGLTAGSGWVLAVGSYAGPREPEGGGSVGPSHVVLWGLQTIGAFPYRDQMAPLATYVLVGTVLAVIVVAALRSSRGAPRAALAVSILLALLLPLALTLATMGGRGNIWQGRYGWPLAMGCLLLAGRLLDRGGVPLPRWVAIAGIASLVLGQAVALVGVLVDERARDPRELVPGWDGPPVLVVGLLCAAALCCWVAAVGERGTRAGR